MTPQSVLPARIGEYEILGEIGTGGMGKIYVARRQGVLGFEKLLAVKTVHADQRLDTLRRSMFLDEAKLVAQLDHPAIAQVYDFGQEQDLLFLVMEYIQGVSFRDLAYRRPSFSVAVQAIHEACRGLHAAHELADFSGTNLGVVHRDVSPENLMLSFDGRVKIVDFGIAWRRNRMAPQTLVGEMRGKPAYMSPEQCAHEPIDRRSDVFSASVVLYELLTGHNPFAAESLMATVQSVLHCDVTPPSHWVTDLPDSLEKAVMRGLERSPDRRFQSASEMAAALEEDSILWRSVSLEEYARAELAEQRTLQLDWLQGLLAGRQSGLEPSDCHGRPTGMATAVASHAAVTETQLPPKSAVRWVGRAAMILLPLAVAVGGFVAFVPGTLAPPTDTPSPSVPRVEATAGKRTNERPRQERTQSNEGNRTQHQNALRRAFEKRRSPRRVNTDSMQPREVKVKPMKAPATDEVGYVTVGAKPYAIVWINGRQVGTTPLIRHKLRIGKHTLRLEDPRSGETRRQQTLNIKKGQHAEIVVR